jgi:hypothetical protein
MLIATSSSGHSRIELLLVRPWVELLPIPWLCLIVMYGVVVPPGVAIQIIHSGIELSALMLIHSGVEILIEALLLLLLSRVKPALWMLVLHPGIVTRCISHGLQSTLPCIRICHTQRNARHTTLGPLTKIISARRDVLGLGRVS